MDHLTGMGDAPMAQLADVDEALEAVADPHERTEVDELREGAVGEVADVEVRNGGVPGIGLKAADRKADPAGLVADVDDLGLALFTDAIAGFGVVDLVPRQLALVNGPVDPAEVHEHAERR